MLAFSGIAFPKRSLFCQHPKDGENHNSFGLGTLKSSHLTLIFLIGNSVGTLDFEPCLGKLLFFKPFTWNFSGEL